MKTIIDIQHSFEPRTNCILCDSKEYSQIHINIYKQVWKYHKLQYSISLCMHHFFSLLTQTYLQTFSTKTALFEAVNLATELTTNTQIFENTITNLSYLPTQKIALNTNLPASPIPIILCGAGPSLQEDITLLQKYQNNFLIIACGSAHKILTEHNIIPDITFILDSSEKNILHFKNIPENNTTFIIDLMVHHEIPAHLHQNFIFAELTMKNTNPTFEYLRPYLPPLPHYPGGYSVSTSALKFAQTIHPPEIIFIGQDLSYPHGNTHHPAHPLYTYITQKNVPTLILHSNNGNENITTPGLYAAYELITKYIEESTCIHTNTSLHGAQIPKAKYVPFTEICKKYETQHINKHIYKNSLFTKNTNEHITEKTITHILIHIINQLQKYQKTLSQISNEIEKYLNLYTKTPTPMQEIQKKENEILAKMRNEILTSDQNILLQPLLSEVHDYLNITTNLHQHQSLRKLNESKKCYIFIQASFHAIEKAKDIISTTIEKLRKEV